MSSSEKRVVLITGASAGIGRATAERLTASGWTVIGASRRATGGDGWAGVSMDVDDDTSVDDGVSGVIDRHVRIDAVVAAAGWGLAGPLELTPLPDAKAQFETNFWGVVRVVRAVLPAMRAQGSGRIVIVSSLGAVVGIPFQGIYSATKFALEGYAEALGYEVGPFGISVTTVQPGDIKTDFTGSRREITPPDGGPYAAAARKAIDQMELSEATGSPAEAVARTIERVLTASRPPRRVSSGKAQQRVVVIAKHLLPDRIFAKATKSALGV
jgi:NAD(P)-dependent dehydrogenase (short-subunit alcohol dehydrogenase family)